MVRARHWLVGVLALALLMVLAAPTLAADAKGKLKSVMADKNEFVVTDANGKDWTFELDKTGKVTLGTKEVKLEDLKPNDMVEIKYDKVGAKLIAKEIRCERK
jgi:hypothetical protein